MPSFDDIRRQEKTYPLVTGPADDTDVVPESPHLLNLHQKNIQLSVPGASVISQKKLLDIYTIGQQTNQAAKRIYLHAENEPQSRSRQNVLWLAIASLVILVIINLINVYYRAQQQKQATIALAYQGFEHIISGGKSIFKIDNELAQANFTQAISDFNTAKDNLWFLNSSLTSNKSSEVKSANALIDSGQLIAAAGSTFTKALAVFQTALHDWNYNDATENSASSTSKKSFTNILSQDFFPLINDTVAKISLADQKLDQVNVKLLPADQQSAFLEAHLQVKEFVALSQAFQTHTPAFLELLGDRYPQSFLMMFANSNEPRPIMGFWGSYALFDLNDGQLQRLSVHDIYERDGQLHEYIEPPHEIKEIAPQSWGMRDSNSSPNFSISAAQAEWFLEKQNGPGAETVLSLDLDLAQEILALTGPIYLKRFSAPITQENFALLTQLIVEEKIDGTDNPKQILMELIPEVQRQIATQKKWPELLALLQKAISEKHILAYSKDEDIQNLFKFISIAGEITKPQPKQDYLNLVYTAIGNKSFAWINEDITHATTIDNAGKISDTLTISHEHTWNAAAEREIRSLASEFGINNVSDQTLDILGRTPTNIISRIYVPKGSVLEKTSGISLEKVKTKYDEQLALTYFSLPISTAPGETSKITLTYRLPFQLKTDSSAWFQINHLVDEYKFLVQKRPGSVATVFEKTLQIAPELRGDIAVPATFSSLDGQNFSETSLLRTDKTFSTVISLK